MEHCGRGDLRREIVWSPDDIGKHEWRLFAANLEPQRLGKLVRWLRAIVPAALADRLRSDTYRYMVGRIARADVIKTPKYANTKQFGSVKVKYGAYEKAISEFALSVFKSAEFTHEPQVVRYLIGAVDQKCLFVDVGAHFGYFSCLAAVRGATVIAVELQRTLCLNIEANALMNDQWRVHVLCAAIGAVPGVTQVERMDPSPGKQATEKGLRPNTYPLSSVNHEIVPVVTLDSIIDPRATTEFDRIIVKVDIEGAEIIALRGAARTIAERQAVFVVEIHQQHVATFDGTVEEVLDHFPDAGWTMTLMTDDGETVVTREEFLSAAGGYLDTENICVRFEPRR